MTTGGIEWRTVGVAAGVTVSFAGIIAVHQSIPVVVTLGLLALASAWYGSLQHEVLHGHPTPWRWVNLMLGGPPLGLAYPFGAYRDTHIAHHRNDVLTDPLLDPESYYVLPEHWDAAGTFRRAALVAMRTISGRLILGPAIYLSGFLAAEVRAAARGDSLRGWRMARHVLGCMVVLLVVQTTSLPLWEYVLGAGYLGQSVSMIRSFAEHRAMPDGSRTAVVRSTWFFSLLFLNNNLHLTHHERPDLAWYELPAAHERMRSDAEAAKGAGLYAGYRDVFSRFLVRPFCQPVHPLRRQDAET